MKSVSKKIDTHVAQGRRAAAENRDDVDFLSWMKVIHVIRWGVERLVGRNISDVIWRDMNENTP